MRLASPPPTTRRRRTAAKLTGVSWDFPNSNGCRQSVHSFHSYPARFIPEIPRAFIEELTPPKDTFVFDPFCGCGTTLVEAQRAGYTSIGVDLNPIACLVARIKTTPLPDEFLEMIHRCITKARCHREAVLPSIPNLSHWFREDVSEAIAALRRTIRTIENETLRQAAEGVLSSIIVRVSNQESDTRYASVNKQVSAEVVFKRFEESARQLALLANSAPDFDFAPATVIQRNIFRVRPADIPGDVGLVITSPPYPNAYEYWLYHKYRMWWLGYDPLEVKANEIGARAHFFTSRRHSEDFFVQMTHVFRLLADTMRRTAHCCFVVGDSKIHGRIVDNAELLIKAASQFDFKLVYRSTRQINPHRKSFNLRHARIKREHILVWGR